MDTGTGRQELGHKVCFDKLIEQQAGIRCSLEEEYIAVSFAAREALWLSKHHQTLQLQLNCILIYVDNQGCLQISIDNVPNKKRKHIDVKYQVIMQSEKVERSELEHVTWENSVSDTMAIALAKTLLAKLRSQMSVKCVAACIT